MRELRKEYNIKKETSQRSYEAIPDLPMGEQVLVDFGHTKQKSIDNSELKLNFIAFVLTNSRYKYKEWLDRPFTTQDVIKAHENAFKWYGGIPNELVYDQDSLIVVSENGGDLILTKEFQKFKDRRAFEFVGRLIQKVKEELKMWLVISSIISLSIIYFITLIRGMSKVGNALIGQVILNIIIQQKKTSRSVLLRKATLKTSHSKSRYKKQLQV